LNVCALNYYLFKIRCKPSPECFCGFEIESIKNNFLHCPLFAAPRLKLLSSGAYIDNNNNVYVVALLTTRTENGDVRNFVLHVLDENYHVKHDSCTLDFMDASFSFVSIAINKAIISS
jgi:hypothetical protein